MGGCKSVPEQPPTPTLPSPGPLPGAQPPDHKETMQPIATPVVLPTYADLYPDDFAATKRPKRPKPRALPSPSPRINPPSPLPNRRPQEPQSAFEYISSPRITRIPSPRPGEVPFTFGPVPEPTMHVMSDFNEFLYAQLQNPQRRLNAVLSNHFNIGVDVAEYDEIRHMRRHLRHTRPSWLDDLDGVFCDGDISLDAYVHILRDEYSSHPWRPQ